MNAHITSTSPPTPLLPAIKPLKAQKAAVSARPGAHSMAMAGPAGATSTSTSSTSTSTGSGGGRFKDVPLLPPDPIIDLNRQIRLDSNPNKVDLGIGAYRVRAVP